MLSEPVTRTQLRDSAPPSSPLLITLYGMAWAYALLFPLFANQLGTAGMGVVNGGLIIIVLVVLLINGMRIPLYRTEMTPSTLILAGLVYYLLAVLGTIAFQSSYVTTGDIYELQRPVLHTLCFVLPLVAIRTRQHLQVVETLVIVSFVATLILASAQIARIIDPLAAFYTKPLNIQSGRATMPFVNPYDLAFVTALPSFLFAIRLVLRRRWSDAVLFGASLILIALTQSRSVFGGYAVGLVVLLPLLLLMGSGRELSYFRIPPRIMRALAVSMIAVGLGFAAVIFVRESFAYLMSGYERVLMGQALNSLDIRVRQLEHTAQLAGADWTVALFGNGPGKAMIRNLESTYVFYTFRYGVIGLLLIKILPLVVVLRELLRTPRALAGAGSTGPLLLALALWYLTVPLMSIGNNFAEQVRVSFLYWGLMGVAVRARTLVRNGLEHYP